MRTNLCRVAAKASLSFAVPRSCLNSRLHDHVSLSNKQASTLTSHLRTYLVLTDLYCSSNMSLYCMLYTYIYGQEYFSELSIILYAEIRYRLSKLKPQLRSIREPGRLAYLI